MVEHAVATTHASSDTVGATFGRVGGGVPTLARRTTELLSLGLILTFAWRLRRWNLDAFTGSFDEGIRSQQLLLMSAGYRPFREIFASQGPLLLDLLYPFYLAFGQTLAAARIGVVACSLVGLLGAWWVGRLSAGPVAGLAAAALLALSPTYLEGSRLALAEVPTIAPALLAIGAALAYAGRGDRRFLIASAACCALALLIKPMVLHVGVPLVAIVVGRAMVLVRQRHSAGAAPALGGISPQAIGRSRYLHDLLLYAGVVAALCALVILALGPAQVWDNLGAYRTGVGRRLGGVWAENLRLTALVLRQEQLGLFALAATGLLLGLWRRPLATVAIGLWAGAIVGLFSLYGDLADKHIVYLVPPLAILGGIGVGSALDATARLVTGSGRSVLSRSGAAALAGPATLLSLAALLGLAAVGVYGWTVPTLYRAELYLIREAPKVAAARRGLAAELDMAEVMRTRAGPDDWVLSDNPSAAFRARRKMIPYLVDTSGTRVDAGALSNELAIEQVAAYRPAVVVTWTRRLGRLNRLTAWMLDSGYRLDRTYDNGWHLYVRHEECAEACSSLPAPGYSLRTS